MLPIKKIYIDTRFKSSDSASDSDFKIDLPTTLLMLEDTGFYIDDVCLPHTWFPVETNVNDKLIFKLIHNTTRVATVPGGNYSVKDLGVAIATAMNASAGVEYFESAYLNTTNALKIKLKTAYASSPFTIYTDATFTSMALPYVGKTINSLLENFTQKAYVATCFSPATYICILFGTST